MEDLSEKEQLEVMRTWWSENGNYVIGGIVVGVAIIFGLNQYRSSIAEAEIAASTLYEDVMFAAGTENIEAAEEAAAKLAADYQGSPYTSQAHLAMARIYMDNARDQDAADALQALIASSPNTELAIIARLRLAKILLYQGKSEDVISLVKDQPVSGFSSRLNEVLGDAYVSLEQYAEAEAAYIAALNDNTQAPTVDVSLIQLKINDLPMISGESESTEPADAPADEPAATDAAEDASEAADTEPSEDEAQADEAPADAVQAEAPEAGESGTQQ